jgi:signal transduction histidine kinase
MKGYFLQTLYKAFFISLTLLLIGSGLSYITIDQLNYRSQKIQHTQIVIHKLDLLLSNLKDAETSVRGYLLTGDTSTLKLYNGSHIDADIVLNQIQRLTVDNEEQQNTIPIIRWLIFKRFDVLKFEINMFKTQENPKYDWKYGDEFLNRARKSIKLMQDREQTLLVERMGRWKHVSDLTPLVIVLVTIVSIVITFFFCDKLKIAYYKNVKLQKLLLDNEIEKNKRIKSMQEVANEVARGNYKIRLPATNSDILGTLSENLNTMIDSLDKSFDTIQDLMKKKDDFISIASHELKTPLTSIKANLQFVKRMQFKTLEGQYVGNFIEKANVQVNKLTYIIADLLDVARINEGRFELDLKTFSLKEALNEVLEGVFINEKSHELILNGDFDIHLIADKFRVEQVLTNLLTNAAKYSSLKSEITVGLEFKSDQILVTVKDQGIGIAKDKKSLVFDRYFRVEETSRNYAGLGLGLFISRGIIERHGGSIGVASEPGIGSTFWFTLPFKRP